jgi:hypothetical protein
MIEIDDIRRQSSKVYVPGSSLRNYKKNKVTPTSVKKIAQKSEDSIISESELDDMMLGDQDPIAAGGP